MVTTHPHPCQPLVDRLRAVVVGKEAAIDLVVAALLAEGHVLLEDVPGVGKTLLARTLAMALDGHFKRVQFSPDLLPSDVTGVSVYQPATGEFRFVQGPVFAHVLLADEINRASPRTQSALLEAMQERHVTVDGTTHALPRPFMVVATQNPAEQHGTFPLPEAQLDRFAISLSLGYPRPEEERRLLRRELEGTGGDETGLEPLVSWAQLRAWQEEVRAVKVDDALQEYLLRVVLATRDHPGIRLGASPRASLTWLKLAQATAYLRGRGYATPEDLKVTAVPVLAHRMMLQQRGATRAQRETVAAILERIPVPD